MRRTRVVRIITRLNIGGPAIQALLLTEQLDPSRYDSRLIAGTPGPHEGDMATLRGTAVEPLYLRSLAREISPLHDAPTFAHLVAILRRWKPDVVHTHLAKAGFLGRLAGRLSGARAVVHTFHGNVLRGYFGRGRSAVYLQLERALARMTDRIISITPHQTAELVALGIARRERIVEIPLGLDLSPFLAPAPGALRHELSVDSTTPLVGIVARLVPIKGVDVFLRAAREIHRARPAARFVVVGNGELRSALEQTTRELGMEHVVAFLGWRRDLAPIYADLDVVVLTSHNEGTPVSLIEAATVGRPIVATAVGGVPDLISDRAGLLVDDNDAAGIAQAVLALLDDGTLARSVGDAARARAYPRYDGSRLLADIDALYRDLTTP